MQAMTARSTLPVRAWAPPVSATKIISENRSDSAPGTLGALLYADKAKNRISEQEWVGLVHAIAAGDQLALRALYERTHRVAFTLIMRITDDRQIAEELTVDVFHDVWRRAATYDSAAGTVLGWIMNQARSRAIDRVRFEQRKKRINPHADIEHSASLVNASEEALSSKERERLLREALVCLTVGEREAIETAFFSELTHAEVATQLKQPLGTNKTRIRSGLGKLRQVLTTGEPER
jgi:RNA polymerase sigma-70 factor, ECF subfamily